ncbi:MULTISPECIES: hypothetical protein [unclassified Microcoleus]|uniref:hypothetical protein n=1 Tax=unclassified Microcoleus TaxID=2642155 RepID=UPI002FD2D277
MNYTNSGIAIALKFSRPGAIAFPFVHPQSSSIAAVCQSLRQNKWSQRQLKGESRLQNGNISLQSYG